MPDHLFSVGELVSFDSRERPSQRAESVFTVRMQMPPLGDELQYRIKSIGEPHERVVTEGRLTRFTAAASAEPSVWR